MIGTQTWPPEAQLACRVQCYQTSDQRTRRSTAHIHHAATADQALSDKVERILVRASIAHHFQHPRHTFSYAVVNRRGHKQTINDVPCGLRCLSGESRQLIVDTMSGQRAWLAGQLTEI